MRTKTFKAFKSMLVTVLRPRATGPILRLVWHGSGKRSAAVTWVNAMFPASGEPARQKTGCQTLMLDFSAAYLSGDHDAQDVSTHFLVGAHDIAQVRVAACA